MPHPNFWLSLLLFPVLVAAPAAAEVYESEQARFRTVVLIDGLTHPWGLDFLADGGILISERPGRLRVLRDGNLSAPIEGVPEVVDRGQGGMLDVAVGPDHGETGWIYIALSGPGEGGIGTQIWRGRLDEGRWVDGEKLFEMRGTSRSGFHFGSRIAFDPEGRLYFSIGDRGEMRRAQAVGDEAGRIHRIEADGSVPPDNPFLDDPQAVPTAFTRGNRNPQGMAVHPETGEIWIHEHGPRGGDEVNIVRAGENYGWPEVTHGIDYSGAVISERERAPGFADPLYVWDPSIAPSGMAFYTGAAFPEWQGDLFVGALKFRQLVRLELEGERVVGEERMLERELGRIRAVEQGPDGLLYLLTDARNGLLVRLQPAE